MEVIKNSKQCILRFFSLIEKLNIINDQHIDQLIKMNKVIDSIVAAVIHELVDELFRTHIKNNSVGMISFYVVTNRLCKMGFAQTYTTIDDKWIERVGTRFFSYRFTGPAGNTITVTFYKCIKCVNGINCGSICIFFRPGITKGFFTGLLMTKGKSISLFEKLLYLAPEHPLSQVYCHYCHYPP
jgi:hypothetical protein